MMKITTYSHNFGEHAVPTSLLEPIILMLRQLDFTFKSNCSTNLRKTIIQSLNSLGWSGKTRIHVEKGISITSMNQRVGLCLQTGNMSRFYADLLKLQSLYQKDKATCAIYILPTKSASLKIAKNVANFERLTNELSLFKHVITMPIYVIGLDEEEEQ
ncbi:Restriction endonuclease BglII [Brevibacillus borstelensis AK1]|uniref:Restriction endonuclease BglII n=2 Tax=Brevibacillus borstelensis TaxID=45462 RepID=M8E612_9BACL|nr:Restriction endonuclease BglII [Brevibacillus borstelensis AK1]